MLHDLVKYKGCQWNLLSSCQKAHYDWAELLSRRVQVLWFIAQPLSRTVQQDAHELWSVKLSLSIWAAILVLWELSMASCVRGKGRGRGRVERELFNMSSHDHDIIKYLNMSPWMEIPEQMDNPAIMLPRS